MSISNSGIIFDIKKFSIHDGPGIRTTVFLKGCPLHCAWCHNPEGMSPISEIYFWKKRCISCLECIEACKHGALSINNHHRAYNLALCQKCGDCAQICPSGATEIIGTIITTTDLMVEIEKDVVYYDQSGGGVTFSGGEPLLQVDFLESLLDACQSRGINTAIDTSGFVPFKSFRRILDLVDLFLYDIKMMDPDQHLQYTGVPNQPILSNIKLLSKAGSNIIPRIPIIPGINDSQINLQATGEFIGSLGTIQEVNILPYHRSATEKYIRMGSHYLLANIIPPSDEYMAEIAYTLESYGFKVKIGG